MNFNKLKILLVDDDEIQEVLLKAKLLQVAEIDYVRSARLSLPIIDSQLNKYDLIISDIEMPLMSGLDLALYVRKVIKSDIAMIAHTASLEASEKFYIKNGFDGMLAKGFQIEEFMNLWSKIKGKMQTLKAEG